MRAVRASGDGGVAVVDVEAIAPPHATDPVVVHVRSCGICASDLHLAEWNLPVTLGHEFAGVLDDGTAVAVQPNAWCGECDRCRAGATQLCRVGASRLAMLGAALGALFGIFLGLPGLLLGPFAGAVAGELLHRRNLQAGTLGHAAKVGAGTWLGILLGTALKLALAFAMLGLFALAWWL